MGTVSKSTDTLASATASSTIAGTGSTASGMTAVVDSAHLYYLLLSDYPRISLVSSMFDEKIYGDWRRVVVIALSAKNKLGFINGSLVIPTADSGLQKHWARCNDMVLSWLLKSLSKEIAESVLYSQSAKDLGGGGGGGELENRFGQRQMGQKFSNCRKS
ncbi:uncharacterized protein [Nicotiana tomentosiformis]|uniref:uncharacterized protein n=1 Tax=Nicotiana tomentosiformis TaxID=4098 RepID=UPI00051BC992|nr:uncharacterized protein LOC117281898 [Nicotiana tomentosiformis]